MNPKFFALFLPLLCLCPLWSHPADERLQHDATGRLTITPPTVPESVRNHWPATFEKEFWDRANTSLAAMPDLKGRYGNTFFENEKQSYPHAIIDFLKGNREPALKFLQEDDNNDWSKQTLGVDWYACFTLRSQVRKYFFYGPWLDGIYQKRFFDSARIWTEKDPLWRPNPDFYVMPSDRAAKGMGKEGWTPEYFNSWVDVRSTDNLRAMREVSIYLMAAETGNQAVAEVYRGKIAAYVNALYTSGMGEWDSANYLGHSLTSWINLYDFAGDRETKLLAKAVLDHNCAYGALKYWRGTWGGPSCRDYNNLGPHAGAAAEFWMLFGDYAEPGKPPYRDFVHLLTTAYRPPEAMVRLARREFPRPNEILCSKPSYEGWTKAGGETGPAYHETNWFGRHTQMGSLPRGHVSGGWDVNGFRLQAESSMRGADQVVVATKLAGSHGICTGSDGRDRLAQYRGNLLWVSDKGTGKFHVLLPRSARIEKDGPRLLVALEKSWLAFHPLTEATWSLDEPVTTEVCGAKNGGKAKLPDDHIWTLKATEGTVCGFALEVGEPEVSGSFEEFRKAVRERSRLDLAGLAKGEIHFTSTAGEKVGLALKGEALPQVFRNGQPHDWNNHRDLAAPAEAGQTYAIRHQWGSGKLSVVAGGATFEGVLRQGRYEYSETSVRGSK